MVSSRILVFPGGSALFSTKVCLNRFPTCRKKTDIPRSLTILKGQLDYKNNNRNTGTRLLVVVVLLVLWDGGQHSTVPSKVSKFVSNSCFAPVKIKCIMGHVSPDGNMDGISANVWLHTTTTTQGSPLLNCKVFPYVCVCKSLTYKMNTETVGTTSEGTVDKMVT